MRPGARPLSPTAIPATVLVLIGAVALVMVPPPPTARMAPDQPHHDPLPAAARR